VATSPNVALGSVWFEAGATSLTFGGTAQHKVLIEAQYQYQGCGSCQVAANVTVDGGFSCMPTGFNSWKSLGNSASLPETRSISCVAQLRPNTHTFSLYLQGSGQLQAARVNAIDLGPIS
jgi:hypothetical protein